jgi:hypothetical protein
MASNLDTFTENGLTEKASIYDGLQWSDEEIAELTDRQQAPLVFNEIIIRMSNENIELSKQEVI